MKKMQNMETKNIKTWEEFIAFLKKNRAYKKYMANIKKDGSTVDDIKTSIDVEDSLKCAFIWVTTDEGHMFWQNLQTKWES